jgi:hypothetical protein
MSENTSCACLDEVAWRSVCEKLADEANRACGCLYDVYVDKFSSAVDYRLGSMTAEQRAKALAIAEQSGYCTPEERAKALQWNAENGFCCHGIEPYYCPAGCGDLEVFNEYREPYYDPESDLHLMADLRIELVVDAAASQVKAQIAHLVAVAHQTIEDMADAYVCDYCPDCG